MSEKIAMKDDLNRRDFLKAASITTASIALGGCFEMQTLSGKKNKRRPNLLLIMVDDMGFSDIGCYGGEIDTPNIDKLAANGVRFTQFYNTGRCCPTRASLLTGLYAHKTGMGWMTASNLRLFFFSLVEILLKLKKRTI